MSHYDYVFSEHPALQSGPFYGIIMAAMRRADSMNLIRLANAFPTVWVELQQRYISPGGYLADEMPRAEGDDA